VVVEVGVEQLLELQVMVAALLQVVLEVLTEQQEQQIRAVAVVVLLMVVLAVQVAQALLFSNIQMFIQQLLVAVLLKPLQQVVHLRFQQLQQQVFQTQ
jgi:hypothetical protein